MLAQQFLSHDALGIEQVDRDALIAVLGMLERKELVLSVPKIRFCNNGDEVRRGRAQI